MLRRGLLGYDKLQLLSNKRYEVTSSGNVFDTSINNWLVEHDGFFSLSDPDNDQSYLVRKEVLVAATSKLSRLKPSVLSKCSVNFVDKNDKSLDTSNLIFVNKGPVEDPELPGWYIIHGFSRYRISRAGDVYSVDYKRLVSTYLCKHSGYFAAGLTPDIGTRKVCCIHRLLAIAFLEYDDDISKLDVNHRDGIKINNGLDNLEWATRLENIIHALKNGLRNDNMPVEVYDVRTGLITEFYSIEECARVLGCNGWTISLRVKTDGQRIFKPGYLFRLKGSTTQWNLNINVEKDLSRSGYSKAITVCIGDEMETFQSMSSAARRLNINPLTLMWRIRNNNLSFKHPEGDVKIIRQVPTISNGG